MRHVELADFHRKGIAMTKQSGDLSQVKSGGLEGVSCKTWIRWLFDILTVASFRTLQTLLAGGPQDIALTVSPGFCVFLIMTAGIRMGS
jgi:hypothetical protein